MIAGKHRPETEVDDVLDNDGSIHTSKTDQTRKRTRVAENNDEQHDDGWRNPMRRRPSNGRVAAKDFEGAVQEILKVAIGLFRSHLTAVNAYLDRISQVSWAKEAWMEACNICSLKINFNSLSDIIQLVCILYLLVLCGYLTCNHAYRSPIEPGILPVNSKQKFDRSLN